MMNEKPGGWIINDDIKPVVLPPEVATAFAEAMEKFVGAEYIPALYCASQLVAGMNYMLICVQTPVVQAPEKHLVTVVIHKPLNKPAVIKEIKTII